MCDLFLTVDVQNLLTNKFIVIIGDSIQRSVYKDLVQILQGNEYITTEKLKRRGEKTCNGDRLIEGGVLGEMTNKKSYREVREYQTDYHLVRFYFVTRCYNNYMEGILDDLSQDPKPDLLVMNSCLWDITRYGASSVQDYKTNLIKLCSRLRQVVPDDCLVMWNTALPVSSKIKGGFLIPEVEFMSDTLRLDIMEANFYARQVVVDYNFDVLDMHFYFRRLMHHRVGDGVHWDMVAHRRMTNLMLTHTAQAWGIVLPCRNTSQVQIPQSSMMNSQQSSERRNSCHEIPPIKPFHYKQSAANAPLWQGAACSSTQAIPPSPANPPTTFNQAKRYGGPIGRTVYYGQPNQNAQIQFNLTVVPTNEWPLGQNSEQVRPCPPVGRYQPYFNPMQVYQQMQQQLPQRWW